VNELIGLLSQEDQPQTLRSTRRISTERERETGLTQSSVVNVRNQTRKSAVLNHTQRTSAP